MKKRGQSPTGQIWCYKFLKLAVGASEYQAIFLQEVGGGGQRRKETIYSATIADTCNSLNERTAGNSSNLINNNWIQKLSRRIRLIEAKRNN